MGQRGRDEKGGGIGNIGDGEWVWKEDVVMVWGGKGEAVNVWEGV